MYIAFLNRILLCSIILSILVCVILLTKKFFGKHLSAKGQYYLWFSSLLLLIAPFLPINKLFSMKIFNLVTSLRSTNLGVNNSTEIISDSASVIQNSAWLQDFSQSVSRTPKYLSIILFSIWISGILIMVCLTIKSSLNIRRIKFASSHIDNERTLAIFQKCKEDCHINLKFNLRTSFNISAPITFGFLKPYIILPEKTFRQFTDQELTYIFLHELNHHKNKDMLVNYLICLLQTLYWFHPLVWYITKEIRTDREILCDNSVLDMFNEDRAVEYGHTILHFADNRLRASTYSTISEIGGTKKQIKKRIIKIASYHNETKWLRMKTALILFLISCLTFSCIPIVTVTASDTNVYNFNETNVVYEDFSSYFSNYDGSFVMYDTNAKQYHIYNKKNSTTRISPNSTYKIYSGLLGLETGVISPENSFLKWNGTEYGFTEWNADHNLDSAMRNSVSWYFQSLDREIGLSKIQQYLNTIGYGNCNLSTGIDDYWLESSLKISPIEQVNLLHSFYTNSFHFNPQNVQAMKNALVISSSYDITLSGKTGTGAVNGKNTSGWFIGYLETPENTYFFATNIQNGKETYGKKALEITLSILNDNYFNDKLVVADYFPYSK